ncbi:MAG: pyridoxal-phosphate dependent enzyme [Candidatus Thorarchaeota archaeon]
MLMVTDIKKAHGRIADEVHRTPIMRSRTINQTTGSNVFFKCENFQRSGSFKIRGALNCLMQLSPSQRASGVITHSSGNHAQALALAARILGLRATVVMPRNSATPKVEAARGYGAEVVFCEPTLESRERVTNSLIEKHGYTLVHPYNDERVIAGAGTAALELLEDVPDLDAIVVPVGGGGLISGSAIAARGLDSSIRVIGAEPFNADDAYRSKLTGQIASNPTANTIADGLRTTLGTLTFPIVRDLVSEIVRVSEAEIVEAMRLLWGRMKLVVEPSGAVPLAALLSRHEMFEGLRTGVILSGGNVDLNPLFEHYRTGSGA